MHNCWRNTFFATPDFVDFFYSNDACNLAWNTPFCIHIPNCKDMRIQNMQGTINWWASSNPDFFYIYCRPWGAHGSTVWRRIISNRSGTYYPTIHPLYFALVAQLFFIPESGRDTAGRQIRERWPLAGKELWPRYPGFGIVSAQTNYGSTNQTRPHEARCHTVCLCSGSSSSCGFHKGHLEP